MFVLGRKVDMLNEFMRQEAIREGKEVRLKEQEYEWGRYIIGPFINI